MENEFFNDENHNSLKKLSMLKEHLTSKIKEKGLEADFKNLSIYCTGSYGRQEANNNSDMDLLVITDDTNGEKYNKSSFNLLKRWVKAWLKSQNIKKLDNNGKYFKPHTLSTVLEETGSVKDDYKNTFTTRMLLLFEGKSVLNEEIFKECRKKIVEHYFRDRDQSPGMFRPVFLLNDIIRYWRTICLNYEYKRSRYLGGSQKPEEKNKQKLANKKLKFHRVWLCYSAIIPLLKSSYWDVEQMMKIIDQTPFERIKGACEPTHDVLFKECVSLYSKFINEIKTVSYIEQSINWDDLNDMAFKFRKKVLEIIDAVCDKEAKSYLLV